MRKKRKQDVKNNLSEHDAKIVFDLTINADIAAFATGLPIQEVHRHRNYTKNRESMIKASQKYRRVHNLSKRKRTYDYWKPEEIEYIMTGTDTDREMSEKLGRTVYSIQKKRERELDKKKKGGSNGRNNKKNK